jgi:tetratricopeptide (TPR) repeat protein
MMAKKQDRTEEGIVAVEEALSRTEKFIEKNQRLLIIVISVVVLVILGFISFKRFYIEPREQEAQEQMFMAEKYFEMDSLDLALYGDDFNPGFLDIIDDYGMTKTANLANYYTGVIYLRLGDYEQAIDYLSSFSSGDQVISSMATGAIGDAYMELEETGRAAGYYIDAAETNNNEFSSPLFYMKAGMAYEIAGDYDRALDTYKLIKNEYPTSTEAREIDKYIARASGLSGR